MAPIGVPSPEPTLRIHVRILYQPLHLTIEEMVEAARRVYAPAGVRLEIGTRGELDLPRFGIVDVGDCLRGVLTPDIEQLFAERDGVPDGEVVVYFVRRTLKILNGCAAHPEGAPGAVVTARATRWTLAHELGHVLGLGHCSDTGRLMFGSGTRLLTRFPPLLVPAEVALIRGSPLLRQRGDP